MMPFVVHVVLFNQMKDMFRGSGTNITSLPSTYQQPNEQICV